MKGFVFPHECPKGLFQALLEDTHIIIDGDNERVQGVLTTLRELGLISFNGLGNHKNTVSISLEQQMKLAGLLK